MRRITLALGLLLALSGAASAQVAQTRVSPIVQTATLSAWTSATALNATQTIFGAGDAGFDAVLVHLVQTTTLTVGAATFEATFDGTNWITVPADAVHDPTSTTWAQISLPYTLQASTNKAFLIHTKGWQGLRIKLSTAITGSGSVTPNITQIANPPVTDVIALSPTAANFNTTDNVSQFGGNAVVTGTGASGSGIPRVTIANDSSLAANQSVNLAQVAGTNTVNGGLAGSLAVGGTDANNVAITQNPLLTSAETVAIATLPTAATAGRSRQAVADIYGDQFVRIGSPNQATVYAAAVSNSDTQILAAPAAGLSIWIVFYSAQSTTSTAATLILEYGTGSNCATGKTTLYNFNVNANTGSPANMAMGTLGLALPAAKALCGINSSATNTANVGITYYIAP